MAGDEHLAQDLQSDVAVVLVELLEDRNRQVVDVLGHRLAVMTGESLLDGWSRVAVVAHLRYIAEAMQRMTVAALEGRSEPMYPGGRAHARAATLVLRPGETVGSLVASLAQETAALDALWRSLPETSWAVGLDDPDHGSMPLSRLLALRLTETEVHSTDLDLPGIDPWDDAFVHAVLPLRVAWLDRARHRPDADLTVDGSWHLTDDDRHWIVAATNGDVQAGISVEHRDADCTIRGSARDLLALILGRPSNAPLLLEGDTELAAKFKAAFPGP